MIYVPDLENYSYFTIINSDTIRAYESEPVIDSNVNYRDYYINSHYIYTDSSELITTIPSYIDDQLLTSEVYYRNDFDSILIIFLILAFVCFYLPTTIIMKLFKKRGI